MTGFTFTSNVRQSLMRAREEAARLRHDYVGTEHVLLGLVAADTSNRLFTELGANADSIRRSVEQRIAKGTVTDLAPPNIPYTGRAKKTLELAMTEARELRQGFVDNEHLILGLIREDKGIGGQVLRELGMSPGTVRAKLLRDHPPDPNARPLRPQPRLLTGKLVLVTFVLWATMWIALLPDVLTWKVLGALLLIFVPPILLMYLASRPWRRWRHRGH